MLSTIFLMSTATCAAALLTLSRVVGFKRVLKHATLVDVVFSIGAIVMMGATMTGALVAVMAGLIMALFLSGMKKLQGWLNAAPAAPVHKPYIPVGADLNPGNAPAVPDLDMPATMQRHRSPVLFFVEQV